MQQLKLEEIEAFMCLRRGQVINTNILFQFFLIWAGVVTMIHFTVLLDTLISPEVAIRR